MCFNITLVATPYRLGTQCDAAYAKHGLAYWQCPIMACPHANCGLLQITWVFNSDAERLIVFGKSGEHVEMAQDGKKSSVSFRASRGAV